MLAWRIAAWTVLFGLTAGLCNQAEARQWKPTPTDAAQDYVIIEHSLSENEGVIVYWVAPETIPQSPGDEPFVTILRSYVTVGVVHFSVSPLGEWTFATPNEVAVETAQSDVRFPLSDRDLPPIAPAVRLALDQVLSTGMGKLGEGFVWHFFDGQGIESCGAGKFWVVYREERYEYETPIPGCS